MAAHSMILFFFLAVLSAATALNIENAEDFIAVSPEGSVPPVCKNPTGRAFAVAACSCKFIFQKLIRVKQNRKVRTLCKELFGPRPSNVKKLDTDCSNFINKAGNVRIKKILQQSNKFLSLCSPDSMIVIMLRELESMELM